MPDFSSLRATTTRMCRWPKLRYTLTPSLFPFSIHVTPLMVPTVIFCCHPMSLCCSLSFPCLPQCSLCRSSCFCLFSPMSFLLVPLYFPLCHSLSFLRRCLCCSLCCSLSPPCDVPRFVLIAEDELVSLVFTGCLVDTAGEREEAQCCLPLS